MNSREDCNLIASAGAIRERDEEAARIGKDLAEALKLRKDPEHRDRWLTTWGTKTNIGLARTIVEMLERHGAKLLGR